jgi:hypothetical protein
MAVAAGYRRQYPRSTTLLIIAGLMAGRGRFDLATPPPGALWLSH